MPPSWTVLSAFAIPRRSTGRDGKAVNEVVGLVNTAASKGFLNHHGSHIIVRFVNANEPPACHHPSGQAVVLLVAAAVAAVLVDEL